MRCQKCGFISFDWLEACGKCGALLSQERDLLGQFLSDNQDINWFKGAEKSATGTEYAARREGSAPDISQVDVSDLLSGTIDSDVVDIEETELARAAEDKEFQKALEEIAR